jgi:hypothetical protein
MCLIIRFFSIGCIVDAAYFIFYEGQDMQDQIQINVSLGVGKLLRANRRDSETIGGGGPRFVATSFFFWKAVYLVIS